jgi:dephospho-CoA kinase
MTKLTIGLTGGISSGKSTVAELFANQGITVIDSDVIARNLLKNETSTQKQVIQHFGNTLLTPEGMLDRKKLRDIIFADPRQRHWLENLLHPIILDEIRQQLAHVTSPYSVVVIPLLVETAPNAFIDRVLVVDTPVEMQILRTCQRDQITPNQAKKIIENQASRQQRRAIADDIIINNGDLAALEEQVLGLHRKYLHL